VLYIFISVLDLFSPSSSLLVIEAQNGLPFNTSKANGF